MTTEERLDRIEHITAGIAEERRNDREEYKTLWRDTQERMNRADERLNRMADAVGKVAGEVDRLAVETRMRIQELAEDARDADKRLEARIERLVSAIGELIQGQKAA